MEKILISSCLLGAKVRYHGKDAFCDHSLLKKWLQEDRLVPLCPEISAGFSAPRAPSEIIGTGGGDAVLKGQAKILNRNQQDVTEGYKQGAEIALKTAQDHSVKIAILKEGSPSCGTQKIYDGNFSGSKIDGSGVTAALLEKNGIRVFNEEQIESAEIFLNELESKI